MSKIRSTDSSFANKLWVLPRYTSLPSPINYFLPFKSYVRNFFCGRILQRPELGHTLSFGSWSSHIGPSESSHSNRPKWFCSVLLKIINLCIIFNFSFLLCSNRLQCKCDVDFYQCLEKINAPFAQTIGIGYGIFQRFCFEFEHPIVDCTELYS